MTRRFHNSYLCDRRSAADLGRLQQGLQVGSSAVAWVGCGLVTCCWKIRTKVSYHGFSEAACRNVCIVPVRFLLLIYQEANSLIKREDSTRDDTSF
jgi:hypothetical protein